MPLTGKQFVQLLKGFAESDRFSHHETPALFIVYAHENEESGKAHANYVLNVIKWLTAIRSRTISDKAPLLWSLDNDQSDPASVHNILDNQFRLLPRSSSNSVDKVIVFGSEVLRQYKQHSFAGGYIQELQTIYEEAIPKDHESKIRTLVETRCKEVGFHHILTELAFLQMRKDSHDKSHGIIPIVLSGDDMEYLQFVERCDVFLKDPSKEGYKLFFKLLKRVYDNYKGQAAITVIENCWEHLQGKDDISDNDIRTQISNGLDQLATDAAGRVRYLDRHDQGNMPHHFMVPFGRNDDFVGRNAILEQLLEKIPPSTNNDDCQRTAIEGLGGIGKTQIALEAAYQIRNRFPDCSIFWVPAIDLTSFENAYREIGRLLQLPGIDNETADVKVLVKTALGQKNAGNWLLIVDNIDDMELLRVYLADYVPFSRQGSILFTTRNRQVAVQLDIPRENIITVQEMDNAEATKLLRKGLKESQIGDAKSIQRLLNFLTNLPLAIKQASAFMASNTDVSSLEYLELCESSDTDLIEILSEEFEDRYRYRDHARKQNPVATTWLISFDTISRQDPQAADYLKFISFLAEKDIPRSLLPVASKLKMKKAISTLEAYAFITEHDTPDAFDIHRLIRLVTRSWLQKKGEWEKWTTKVVQELIKEYPFPRHENREIWTKYLPHGQAVLEVDGAVNTERNSNLLHNIAESYFILGKYDNAELLYRQTLELREEVLGREHPDTLASMNNLAGVLDSQGKYEEAEAILASQRTVSSD
ncbi:hypothetical protein NPX13_g5363 [Xylaria arbuscula]|uniref:NB-ARC domain-containing protein n=1 Tax=Xylaria arbuscula TaxID=114810 RepID=A0A9W8NE52_9PEZI|nr:hypothetical protein NPX13_g5363 [Xylaria arbuscula]